MIVRDSDNPYAFVHNPRTSGTSITKYLIEQCGGRRLSNVPEQIATHSIYAEEIKYRKFDNHYFFGFIRNPWSREWSLHKWHNKTMNKDVGFKQWLLEPSDWYRSPQYGMFCDMTGKLKVNLFRFEDRTNAIVEISNVIGTDSSRFESYNANNGFNTGTKYIADYDNEMIDCVAKRYAVDIEAFGYYFDGYHDTIKEVEFYHNEDTLHYGVKKPEIKYINV